MKESRRLTDADAGVLFPDINDRCIGVDRGRLGGGVGGSSAAAACAMRFAQKGKRALYLNLERFGSADVFFSAEGSSSLGDVIYAVKSQKGNLEIRLESSVKRDGSGVFFFSPPKLALDTAELA